MDKICKQVLPWCPALKNVPATIDTFDEDDFKCSIPPKGELRRRANYTTELLRRRHLQGHLAISRRLFQGYCTFINRISIGPIISVHSIYSTKPQSTNRRRPLSRPTQKRAPAILQPYQYRDGATSAERAGISVSSFCPTPKSRGKFHTVLIDRTTSPRSHLPSVEPRIFSHLRLLVYPPLRRRWCLRRRRRM